MKIYHIINSLRLGGAERLVVDLCTELSSSSSDEIHLIVLDDIDTPLKREIQDNKNIKLQTISAKNLYDFRIPYLISKKISKADIIHLHLFPTLYWGIIYKILFFWKKQKFIFTEHSTENNRRAKWYLKKTEQFIYSRLNYIICISKSTKDNLIEHLGLRYREKIGVINNGINLNKFYTAKALSRQDFNISDNDLIVIQVASFRPAKDQKTLIKALTLLPSEIKALFVGEGPELEKCKELVKRNNLENRVTFLGNRSDIAELLKMSDVAVVSSNYEGFGIVAVEGMACNKPVVASNVPGLSEVVEHYGVLFDKGKEEYLADLIQKLYANDSFYKQISDKCSIRSKDFSIKEIANQYQKIYSKL